MRPVQVELADVKDGRCFRNRRQKNDSSLNANLFQIKQSSQNKKVIGDVDLNRPKHTDCLFTR